MRRASMSRELTRELGGGATGQSGDKGFAGGDSLYVQDLRLEARKLHHALPQGRLKGASVMQGKKFSACTSMPRCCHPHIQWRRRVP